MTITGDTEVGRCPIGRCPTCSGTRFRSVTTTQGVAFRCTSCGSSWRFELGHLTVRRDSA